MNIEFFLRTRSPWLWFLFEEIHGKYRIEHSRKRCAAKPEAASTLPGNIRGYCMFVGHPRSGHSALGTLLNAHQNLLISHNLDAVQYFRAGFSREDVYFLIQERDRAFSAQGRSAGGYSYTISGQHQDNYSSIQIFGDKRAGATSRHLQKDPDFLKRLPDLLGLPVWVLLHVRNPWDNISSMFLRPSIRLGRSLPQLVDWYFELMDAACAAVDRADSAIRVIPSRHEQLIKDAPAVLARILGEFGLSVDDDYYQACRDFVHAIPRKTREQAPWTASLVENVRRQADRYPLLAGYDFDT